MKLLSIIVLFCDKDVQYLPNILWDIQNRVKVSHEIILVDNRENDKSDLPEGNYKINSNGTNAYQFEGRRLGLDIAHGQYVWYVDADDSIINNIEEKDFRNIYQSDVIQFFYENSKGEINPQPGVVHSDNLELFGMALWCRFIKTKFLKMIMRNIKRNIVFSGYEDRYLLRLITDNMRNVSFIDKVYYRYNFDTSVRFSGIFTQEKYDQLEIGIENLDYLSSFLKEPERFIKDINYSREYQHSRIKE